MRVIIQRVKRAKVAVANKTISQIGCGFLVLLGVANTDTEKEADWLAKKIVNLRVMADKEGKMNKSIKEVNGEVLVVSQFTLYGDCRKGNRPSFIMAADQKKGKKYYELFLGKLREYNLKVQSGIFGALMQVELVNDGPVTIIIDREI